MPSIQYLRHNNRNQTTMLPLTTDIAVAVAELAKCNPINNVTNLRESYMKGKVFVSQFDLLAENCECVYSIQLMINV